MAKFNLSERGVNRTTTYEGAPAFKTPNAKEDLVRKVLTTFFGEPKFYGNVNEQTKDLVSAIRNMCCKDPAFVRNLAIYARNTLNLRSVTHAIMAEMAAVNESKPFVREVMKEVVVRPDDMTETLAYFLNNYGKPVPNSLKKGLADVFPKFDEYQLQKYNRNQAVKLKDILCIAHPRPSTMEYSDMWKRLLEDNLKTPYTWETVLSARGNNKETWEELIESGKVGYMALLRNLRNILKADPNNVNKVMQTLSNRDRVLKSRQLPFRFYAAYREIEQFPSFNTEAALETLEEAIGFSVGNVERLSGKTLLSADGSGSMTWSKPSQRSTITCAEIAGLLMSIAQHSCDSAITSTFSNTFEPLVLNRQSGVLTNTRKVVREMQVGATNMFLIFKWLLDKNIYTDRIIVISDDQAHPDFAGGGGHFGRRGNAREYFEQYRAKVNRNVWLHIMDTAGYGRQQFLGENVNYVAGWSDKVLSFIPLVEKGVDNMVKYIENLR
ncbi:MAG: TROVE domain-containing protein [Candidatus Caldatribacteriota bacterium]